MVYILYIHALLQINLKSIQVFTWTSTILKCPFIFQHGDLRVATVSIIIKPTVLSIWCLCRAWNHINSSLNSLIIIYFISKCLNSVFLIHAVADCSVIRELIDLISLLKKLRNGAYSALETVEGPSEKPTTWILIYPTMHRARHKIS